MQRIFTPALVAFVAYGETECPAPEKVPSEEPHKTTKPPPIPAKLNSGTATIEARSGSEIAGTVTFTERIDTYEGETLVVDVAYDITGITPGDTRGFHIHEIGDCSAPDATSAGAHFNPGNHAHGPAENPFSHAGDLGNITANPAGRAEGKLRGLAKISLHPARPNNVLGRAVIVHAAKDDLTTQPTGGAGARVGCGVIKPPGE
jgi:Cu-Zn family superoxide dismutase